jgi:hypothetical protein
MQEGNKKFKSELHQIMLELKALNDESLVSINVSRKNGEIVYSIDCAKDVKSEELAHYLDEIIEGICTWKPEVCEEPIQSFTGTIQEIKIKK